METKRVWNGLEVAKFIASLATPIAVVLIGFWINKTLKAEERRFSEAQIVQAQQFSDAQRAEDRRFEEAQRKLYREDQPHIELTLGCTFHGIRGENRLATFTVSAKNVGRVEHKFDEIWLRVRGIKDGPFEYDADSEPHEGNAPPTEDEHSRRASFPDLLFKRNLVPATKTTKWRYIFIEPGVKQNVSFTTLVPSDYSYLLAHVRFEYEKYRPHTAEAVFEVRQEVSG